MNNLDPYRNSKLRVLDHLKSLIDIMSFKFQPLPPRASKSKWKWVETVENGVSYMQAVEEVV
jgi:hypothetical protein